jgi:preprotein translocase subunit Sec63
MSAQKIGVFVVCLLVGYWVVSAFLEAWAARKRPTETLEEDPAPHWSTILKVSRDASLQEIQEAYRAQISQYHPDKVSRLGEELKALAEKKSKEINGANEQAAQEKRP